MPLSHWILNMNSPIDRFNDRYRFQTIVFMFIRSLLRLIVGRKQPLFEDLNPKKILICNFGHQGDIVISTAFLRQLRSIFPLCVFDYLAGPYSKPAIDTIEDINKVYYINHWYLSKSIFPGYGLICYIYQIIKLRAEIKGCNYDIAIDLRAWFPNSIFIIWLAGIPQRVGWDRYGLGPLLTHPSRFNYDQRHEIEHQLDLLRFFPNAPKSFLPIRMVPLRIDPNAFKKIDTFLGGISKYCVIHMSGSTQSREWTIFGWVEVLRYCLDRQIIPVITGIGKRALTLSTNVLRLAPGAIGLVDKLSWTEYVALISKAEFVISIETSAGHIAAALNKPTISIYGGMADWRHWKPFGQNVFSISADLECSPCFKKLGCQSMACLQNLGSNKVIASIDQILEY